MATATATSTTPAGTRVSPLKGVTGKTAGEPVLTATGYVVTVEYDAEFAHLSPTGGADFAVEECKVIEAAERQRALRNPNLDRHMAEVAATLEAADAKGEHTHAAVRTGVGATQSGPVLAWRYDAEEEGYGAITLVNYKGEELFKPLVDVCLYDIRPCWDRCKDAPAPAVEVKEMTVARPAARTPRAALGPASADGWELLYDKPKAGAEVGRRYKGDKAEYALICKAHGHVHPLTRLGDEGAVRRAGGWCPSC